MLEPTRSDSKTYDELTSTEKAAIVLISMGRELSGQVMRSLPEEDVERNLGLPVLVTDSHEEYKSCT